MEETIVWLGMEINSYKRFTDWIMQELIEEGRNIPKEVLIEYLVGRFTHLSARIHKELGEPQETLSKSPVIERIFSLLEEELKIKINGPDNDQKAKFLFSNVPGKKILRGICKLDMYSTADFFRRKRNDI